MFAARINFSRRSARFGHLRTIGGDLSQRLFHLACSLVGSDPEVADATTLQTGKGQMTDKTAIQRIQELDRERATLFEQAKEGPNLFFVS
jgi:hypothetical protein